MTVPPSTSAGDWRSQCTGISSLLIQARHDEKFTDVQFIFRKGKSKIAFNAHKIVLACGSQVFESMFYGPMAESKSIIRTDDDPEAFDTLLKFFYGKSQRLTSLLSVWKFYIIGDKYLVPDILWVAKRQVDGIKISEDDFWDVIESDVFNHPLFFDKLNAYLKKQIEKIVKSDKFLSVQESFIDKIVKMDKLNIDECDLLLAVTQWAFRNSKQANWDYMLNIYKYIRFCNLSSAQYFRFIDCYPEAIETKSSLGILQYLHNRSVRFLPSWCSTSSISRKREFENEGGRKITVTFLTSHGLPFPGTASSRSQAVPIDGNTHS